MPYTFLPLSTSKRIYSVKEDDTLFAKGGMTRQEMALQKTAAALGFAPNICGTHIHEGRKIVLMDRIQGSSLADFYGEDPRKTPSHVWTSIRMILQTLWNHGIEYTDITPYNFLLEVGTERVWIVDFGHARRKRMDPFLRNFLEGECDMWNTEFG